MESAQLNVSDESARALSLRKRRCCEKRRPSEAVLICMTWPAVKVEEVRLVRQGRPRLFAGWEDDHRDRTLLPLQA